MEHLRIVKQKFSNKKNYFKKETFADLDFCGFWLQFYSKYVIHKKFMCTQFFKIGHPRKFLSAE